MGLGRDAIDSAAIRTRRTLGVNHFIGHVDQGFFGQRKLTPAQWRKLIDRAAGVALNAEERKAEPLDDEDRRRFLSAAGWLCGHGGQVCPDCQEKKILGVIGLQSLDDLGR